MGRAPVPGTITTAGRTMRDLPPEIVIDRPGSIRKSVTSAGSTTPNAESCRTATLLASFLHNDGTVSEDHLTIGLKACVSLTLASVCFGVVTMR